MVQTVKKRLQLVSESKVTFDKLSKAQIAEYVASGEPMGKAGSYAVQGRAAMFIRHISGSYSGIMGLPLYETGAIVEAPLTVLGLHQHLINRGVQGGDSAVDVLQFF